MVTIADIVSASIIAQFTVVSMCVLFVWKVLKVKGRYRD